MPPERPTPDAPTADQPARPHPPTPVPGHPGRVGPYVIREVIGEGGFGIVYAAEQVAPMRRRVALKVIKPGMDSRAVVARFEAERQALAVMDHAGVARVFDGGTVPDGEPGAGRPFFVMEYVAGEPITSFCDRHRLTIDERVGLFIQVCEAVQHAHTKGVVHRDIKPSNILVAYADGAPRAKVIDFGIAKALNQRLSEATLFTERGQMIGTPEYMSPEQAEMSGLDIDTRADVYSLGVVLYELLAGVRPFELQTSGLFEIQRALREVVPERPSTRVRRLAEGDAGTPEQIARARRSTVRHMSRVLRGDLDAIVESCLQKDRGERYPSASELAADLRRYLEGEPIQTRAAGGARRALRFARRHERVLSAIVLIIAVCLLLIAQLIVVGVALDVLGEDPEFEAWLAAQDTPMLPPGRVHAVLIAMATVGLLTPFIVVGIGSFAMAFLARSWRVRVSLLVSSLLALVLPTVEMIVVVDWMNRVSERQAAEGAVTGDAAPAGVESRPPLAPHGEDPG